MNDSAAAYPDSGSGARVELSADGSVIVTGRPGDSLRRVARVARRMWNHTHVVEGDEVKPPAAVAGTGFCASLDPAPGGDQ